MEKSIFLVLLAVVIGVAGQLTLKIGMTQVGQICLGSLAQPLDTVIRVAGNPLIITGLSLYALGAAIWLVVLSRLALSYAYPILALSYAVTPLFAWLILGEAVPPVRWVGIAVICVGVSLISRS
jgi:multidrug transporter EmrE-like cation transporter